MSIKLIAVDIDGTLVNSKKEITPEVFSAIQDAKEAGVHTLDLGAQVSALGFYEKLGFKAEGDIFLDAGIEHRNMVLKLS